MTPSLLLVEDDVSLAELIAADLRAAGYDVACESDGNAAVRRILSTAPDAVILDLDLPGLNGREVCRRVRSNYRGGIMMLTAHGDETDEVLGLEIGADDYVVKPVRPRVLRARLRALLRRPGRDAQDGPPRISAGRLRIESHLRKTFYGDNELDLSDADYDLVLFLCERVGKIVTREELYSELRGIRYDGLDRSIDRRISRLRRKLDAAGAPIDLLRSVRGVGYFLSEEV